MRWNYHQEHKTVHTASGIVKPILLPAAIVDEMERSSVSFTIAAGNNQQDATFSRSIYFFELLYMFQAIPPPIIKSTKLYIRCMYSFVFLMMGRGTD
jgi:hypothetical protein